MIDSDTILSKEDHKALKAYRKERAEGTLISFEQVRKELGF